MRLGRGVPRDERPAEATVDEELFDLITQLTNEINWCLRERGLSRADLASRMGVSPGRVSQILGGGENLTLRTLAALSTALGARFDIALRTPEAMAADARTARDTAWAAGMPAEHPSFPRARRLDNGRVGSAYRHG
jgi:transcriptional regulator with XRE-family HTH domain